MLQKNNLLGLTREELQDYLISLNEKPYRGLQIFEWIHNRGVIDFDSMTNLGKNLIQKLKQHSIIEVPEVIDVSTSTEGTKKFLLKLDNDSFIEMVKIPEKKDKLFASHRKQAVLCNALFVLPVIMDLKET
jgi:23S rRNA (adenine2503-C2)-methyltransferase